MDKSSKTWRITAYVPELLVLLLSALLLLYGIHGKQGYHMDELLSFELANAEFNPWIVPTQPQGRLAKFVENELRGDTVSETWSNLADTVRDVLKNRGASRLLSYRADVYEEPVWIAGEDFRDYVTVGERDAFNYLSVYFNVKDDNHPPLHFMVLHTVSSVFRGKISPLMGCGINLVCVLGVMILLMRLGRELMTLAGYEEYGRSAGLWAAGLYGLSAAALSTTLLIRMYAMVTLFCVALFVIHLDKIFGVQLRGKTFIRGNKTLILVTAAGFWTQYFFLFYCLILAAVTAVVLWRGRRKRELVSYIRVMVTAAVIGVAVFPFSVADVFSSGRGVEALDNLSSGFAGYGVRLAAFGRIALERLGIGCMAAIGTVWAVLAVLTWRKRRDAKAGCSVAVGDTVRKEAGGADGLRRALWALLWVPAVGYFLLAARMSPYLVDRYIMPVFPFLTLGAVAAVCSVWAGWCGGRQMSKRAVRASGIVLILVTVAAQLLDPLRYKDSYLYTGYKEQREIADTYADRACICIYRGVGYYENLLEFARYERTLLLTEEQLQNRRDKESIDALGQVVVLLKQGTDREKVRGILEEAYGLECEETLLESGEAYGDTIWLFGSVEGQ